MDKLIEKRKTLTDELKQVKVDLNDLVKDTQMYKDLFDHCSETKNFNPKEAEKYCINTVLKSFDKKK